MEQDRVPSHAPIYVVENREREIYSMYHKMIGKRENEPRIKEIKSYL